MNLVKAVSHWLVGLFKPENVIICRDGLILQIPSQYVQVTRYDSAMAARQSPILVKLHQSRHQALFTADVTATESPASIDTFPLGQLNRDKHPVRKHQALNGSWYRHVLAF